jgi:hypothetical protein
MLVYSFLLTFLLTSFDPAPPESPSVFHLKYILLHDGKQIGSVKARSVTQGNQVIYETETQMTIRVVMNQDIDYSTTATFQNGIMVSSKSKSFFNNKLHHNCTTQWRGKHYEIKRDNNRTTLARQINYCGGMLYFKEPVGVSLAYSELAGLDNKINKVGDRAYTLTDSKSKKVNKYWYKGGILEHAYINHTLLTVEVKRVY